MLDACHEHGLTPMRHVPPLHVAALGRRRRRLGGATRTAERFARFCERTMRHLGDLVPLACTLNETGHRRAAAPGVRASASAHRRGAGPPRPPRSGRRPSASRRSSTRAAAKAAEVMRDAHRPAVDAIKGVRGETQVGLTVAMSEWEAAPGGEETLARLRGLCEDPFLEGVARRLRRRPELLAHPASAPTARSTSRRRRADADGLRVPARGARARHPPRAPS